jgi:hypothetical protein
MHLLLESMQKRLVMYLDLVSSNFVLDKQYQGLTFVVFQKGALAPESLDPNRLFPAPMHLTARPQAKSDSR